MNSQKKKIGKEKNGDKLSIEKPTTSSVYMLSTVPQTKFALIEICIFKQITRKYL